MKFQVGNNLGGRKKGSKGKATQNIRNCFQLLIEDNLEQLKEDFKELEPKDRIKLLIDLSGFIIPKLKQVDAKVEASASSNLFNIREIYNTNDNELEA